MSPSMLSGIGPKGSGGRSAPPPDSDDMPGAPPEAEPDGDEGSKKSPAKALVSHENENCGNCTNYHGEDGSCEEVSGQYDPTDRCWSDFNAAGGGGDQEPDTSQPPPMDDNAGDNGQ
jgi:hypothetical protein